MKRLFFILFSLLTVCRLTAQTDSVAQTNVAEQISDAYKAKDYATVISTCEAIIQDGKQSADLYYNLGNAYFKSNELPKAILYYEKALLLSPNDKDIQYNLAFANSQQPDNIEHLSLGFLPRLYQKTYQLLQVDTWAMLGIIFFILLGLSLCVFLFSQIRTRKKIALTTLLCSLILGITSVCCANSRYNELTKHEYAIVVEPTTTIKTEPMVTATDLATIHGGIKVKIIEDAFGWLKVELGNKKEGWIMKEFVEKI